MASVGKDSANWRLFGGGGLLAGGVVWLIAVLITLAAPGPIGGWLGVLGVLVVGIALFLVWYGETGSNGAVGNSVFGKVSLSLYGLGWILFAVVALLGELGVGIPVVLSYIAGALVIIGSILSVLAIWQRGVARGAARWILAVPAVLGILYVISAFGWVTIDGWWLEGLLALSFAVTGLLYLLNRKDVG